MTLTDRDLIGNTDALDWATDFCERFDGFVVRPDQADDEIIDVGGMFAWFANAIMAGFDQGYGQQRRDLARMLYALDHGWNRAQYEYACERELWEDDELAEILPALKFEEEWAVAQQAGARQVLGDPTEYEVFQPTAFGPAEGRVVNPTHEYADEDVARLAQQVEDLYDVIGDILCNTVACQYDDEEWCTVHGVGRPCPIQIARALVEAK